MSACQKSGKSVWRGKNILIGDSIGEYTVTVEDGKVKEVVDGIVSVEGVENVIDVEMDKVMMPGIVDSHVHINEPGRTDWEGFETATRAAAYGGITTVVDMPLNSIPPTTTKENLLIKLKSAQSKCSVDVAFWGGVVPNNSQYLREMVKMGVPGFKCFLIHSGVDEFPSVDEEQVKEALLQLKGTEAKLLFHAECEVNVDETDEDPSQYETFLQSRPEKMENVAIEMIIRLCRLTRVPCHIVHLSAAEALPMIIKARGEGLPLTVETCYHYLTLTAEEISPMETQYKCCPPIRGKKNQDKLWDALTTGHIDMVVSDHSPCTRELKLPGEKDFMSAWGGISSLQFGLSLFWTSAQKRGFGLTDVNRLLSREPAKLANLENRKGKIQEGFDADFVIWAPNESQVIKLDKIQHKNKVTPYINKELCGVVYSTVLGGNIIYRKGTGSVGNPNGKLLVKC